ncbi:MAG: low molecular weight phosphotyrosine protein phosphatase [Ruminiclostridium sp.]|nr:low molecular weight phosphotyrosine protein phosphatase [Ruminiclostridium sp.]
MIKRICFVCHGNICRSPMAEFLFKDMLKERGLDDMYLIESRATSTEEIGNPPHHGTMRKLAQFGIVPKNKYAEQLKRSDYDRYDLIIGMDDANIRNIVRIVGGDEMHKVYKLPEFSGSSKSIADPWFTGNFDETYDDIKAGCDGLLRYLGI